MHLSVGVHVNAYKNGKKTKWLQHDICIICPFNQSVTFATILQVDPRIALTFNNSTDANTKGKQRIPLGESEVLEKFKCLSPKRSLANWAPREETPATREEFIQHRSILTVHECLGICYLKKKALHHMAIKKNKKLLSLYDNIVTVMRMSHLLFLILLFILRYSMAKMKW